MPVVIFKAVEKCNSNCIYCDVIKKNQRAVMPHELLETVFGRLNEYLLAHPEETMTFTWHGGEVCLLGVDYFEDVIGIIARTCPDTRSRIKHLVQSNLTLLTDALLATFQRLGVDQIGSSYEPLPHLRGFGEDRDSDAYNRAFMRGVSRLEQFGFGWGVIYVVNRRSLPRARDLFTFLTNLCRARNPVFNMIYIYGEDPHNLRISPREYADFLGEILPLWWQHRDRYPHVQPFAGLLQNLTSSARSLVCECSGSCAHQWLYVGPTGDTSQCGRAGDYGLVSYGNIRDRSVTEILADSQRDLFVERQQRLRQGECRECELWEICHGGCPLDSYMVHGDYNHPSPKCEFLKVFLRDHFGPVTGVAVGNRSAVGEAVPSDVRAPEPGRC